MFLKLQTTEDTIRIAEENLKKDYKTARVLTADAKAKKERLDQTVAEKQKKVVMYQKKLASNKALLAQFEAEEQKQISKPATSPSSTNSKKEDTSTMISSSGHLIWPVPSCHSISSGYGYRLHPVTGVKKLHAGIDIPCSTGTSVVAAASGNVVDAGYNGNYLKINHGNELETMYLHCSKLLVSAGSRVSGGQTIARSGATGMVSGAHLHFVVKKNGNYVNPQNYL